MSVEIRVNLITFHLSGAPSGIEYPEYLSLVAVLPVPLPQEDLVCLKRQRTFPLFLILQVFNGFRDPRTEIEVSKYLDHFIKILFRHPRVYVDVEGRTFAALKHAGNPSIYDKIHITFDQRSDNPQEIIFHTPLIVAFEPVEFNVLKDLDKSALSRSLLPAKRAGHWPCTYRILTCKTEVYIEK